MFRKILFLVLLTAGYSGSAQKIGPDHTCFDIEIDLDYERERDENCLPIKDKYVVCRDQTIFIPPIVDAELRRTDTYGVTSLPYNPYPLTGTDIIVRGDDMRAVDDITLPFKFCYFDEEWDKISVHGNGYLSFTDGTNYKQDYPQGSNDPTSAIPTVDTGLLNTIMFFKHTHWNNSRQGDLRYAVYGTAPCRVFVVSWVGMLAYQLSPLECTFVLPQTHQIALHETTNFIDIISIRHNTCPPDARGFSVMGINNKTGTQGYTPPGRNLGPYDAEQEAWRFFPSGELQYRLEWFVDGDLVKIDKGGEETPLELVVDKHKTVEVFLVEETCANEEHKEGYKITIKPAIEIDKLDMQPIVCDKDQHSYDLINLERMVRDAQTNPGESLCEEYNGLNFLYYRTENDAKDRINAITGAEIRNFPIQENENYVYLRVEPKGIELQQCFEILEANIVKAPVEVIDKTQVFLCDEYTLPVLTNDEFYYKIERLDEDMKYVVKTIPDVYENMMINEAGYYRVYVKKTNKYGCEDVKSSLLMVESCKYPKGISPNYDGENDYLDLTYNNVHELKIYNRHGKLVYEAGSEYKREWAGQDLNGKLLPAGTYFLYVKTKNYEYQDWLQLIYEAK